MANQVALITGGSRGLGYSLAKQLLKSGWNVIIDSRNTDGTLDITRLELTQFGKVTCISGDVSEENHIQQIADAVKPYKHLDLIVNNASTLGIIPLPYLLDYSIKELNEVFRVNVFAPLAIIQILRPYLLSNSIIINVTSDAGVEAYPGWGGYGSSKAALEHMSSILAVENQDMFIYWVDPGDMQTELKQNSSPNEDISSLPLPEEVVPGFIKLIEGKLPSGRYKAQELIEA